MYRHRFINNLFLCVSMIFHGSTFVFGQVSAPKYSNEFLAIGVGARAQSMGNTHVSVTNDIYSPYWNPAGLASIETDYAAALMHSSYFGGISNYNFGAFSVPIDQKAQLAISVIRLSIDNIPDTRFLYDASGRINYDNIRFFSAADNAVFLSYATSVRRIRNLDFGMNFKIIYRKAGDFANAWGFGLDLGWKYLLNKKWNIGLLLRDVTGTYNAWSHNPALLFETYQATDNIIPDNSLEITLPRIITGISREFVIKEDFSIHPALDLEITFDGKRNVLLGTDFFSVDPRAGIEFGYKKLVFLRSGVNNFQQIKDFDGSFSYTMQWNFGAGIELYDFRLDYALANATGSAPGLNSHIISLSTQLNFLPYIPWLYKIFNPDEEPPSKIKQDEG